MASSKQLLIFSDSLGLADFADLPHPGVEVTCVAGGDRRQLLDIIADYDAYVCTLRIRVDAEVVGRGTRLRVVATPSTGLDHLDLECLRQQGITVLSNRGEQELLNQITATAELAFGLLLTCARHLPQCFTAARAGRWEKEALAGAQLRGKTLGIIGLGRLGTMMARYGQAFWMRVVGCRRSDGAAPPGVERLDLPAVLAQSDFVSLHVHTADSAPPLLGAVELGRMKTGSVLINTSRGHCLDEAALIREMEAGRIAAAGLDVITGEWRENKEDHLLIVYSRKNPRLYISPHVGGATPEAIRLVMRHTFLKVVDFLRTSECAHILTVG